MTDENIFFDTARLKYRGTNVIIGKTCRIRYPELVELHDNVIIDDFVYISTGLIMESYTVIEPGCVLMGGKSHTITMKSYSALAPHVTALCSSNNFETSFTGAFSSYQCYDQGSIMIGKYAIVGAQVTLLPGVNIGEGVRIGASSLVKKDLDAWNMYAGIPAQIIKSVDRSKVLDQVGKFESKK